MYLSRLQLTGEQFRNPYEIHRALWAVFPEAPDQTRDFLFRIEQRSLRQAQILMQSSRSPERSVASARIIKKKAFELNLIDNQSLRFLLVANPVKTIKDEQGRLNSKGEVKKCRIPLIYEEEQVTWLRRKFREAALLKIVEVEQEMPVRFRKGSKPGKIQPYIFKGMLQVKDSSALTSLLEQGIGPAKAFGCGMLSLAPF